MNERTIRRAIACGALEATRRHRRFHIAPAALAAHQTRRPAPESMASSPETVAQHIGNVLGKLGVRSRTAAADHYLTSQNG